MLGFLGGIVGLSVPRRAAMKVEQAAPTPIPSAKATAPIADRVATRGAAWSPAEDRSGAPSALDSRTPADIGSRR